MEIITLFINHEQFGKVMVEAEVTVKAPEPNNTASDYDCRGYIDINDYEVFLMATDGRVIGKAEVAIDEKILYSEISRQVRDHDIDECLEAENGGF